VFIGVFSTSHSLILPYRKNSCALSEFPRPLLRERAQGEGKRFRLGSTGLSITYAQIAVISDPIADRNVICERTGVRANASNSRFKPASQR
jgi:hypothetical protein